MAGNVYRASNGVIFTPVNPVNVPTPMLAGGIFVFKDSTNNNVLSQKDHLGNVQVLLTDSDMSEDDIGAILSPIVHVDKTKAAANTAKGIIANGSEAFPFASLSAAGAAITAASYTGATIDIAFGTYTETSAVTLPNIPLIVYGNGSTITFSAGITVPNPDYTRYDLHTVGNVAFSSTATGRVLVQGGSITGNISIAGLADFKSVSLLGGVITVVSTGQFLAIVCTLTSTITGAGVLFIRECNFNTAKAGALITSTTGGTAFIADNIIVNSGNGGLISCDNGADGTLRNNAIVNNYLVNSGSGVPVIAGTSATIYSKNNLITGVANTGTGYKAVNNDMIGAGTVVIMGSDAVSDIYYRASTGVLTALHAPASAGTYKLTCDGTTKAISWTAV